jgi:hypothetical protein
MLGEQIGEDKGKITGQRVLEVVNGVPKIETSMSTIGKYKGVETTEIATYWASPGPDGVMRGEGQGVITTKDGSEMATWTGQGIGRFTHYFCSHRNDYHWTYYYSTIQVR